MPLFYVPVSLGVQKHCFPTSTSAAQLHFRAKHNARVKIDLPLKVSEETQMAISYATAQHVQYAFIQMENIHALCINAPAKRAYKSSSLLTSRQPTHLCYDISSDPCPAFMSLLIACVYSQTS